MSFWKKFHNILVVGSPTFLLVPQRSCWFHKCLVIQQSFGRFHNVLTDSTLLLVSLRSCRFHNFNDSTTFMFSTTIIMLISQRSSWFHSIFVGSTTFLLVPKLYFLALQRFYWFPVLVSSTIYLSVYWSIRNCILSSVYNHVEMMGLRRASYAAETLATIHLSMCLYVRLGGRVYKLTTGRVPPVLVF